MRYFIAVAFGLTVIGSAVAGDVATHNIPWYAEHEAARNEMLRLCRSDYSYAKRNDCLNAEQGEAVAYHRKLQRQNIGNDPLNDPSYWAQNKIARISALAECKSGRLVVMTPSSCAAAKAAEMAGAR